MTTSGRYSHFPMVDSDLMERVYLTIAAYIMHTPYARRICPLIIMYIIHYAHYTHIMYIVYAIDEPGGAYTDISIMERNEGQLVLCNIL